MQTRIEVEIDGEKVQGHPQSVRIVFGPHHYIGIVSDKGLVRFELGATHHGFSADASTVNSQLEQLIGEIRERHPELSHD